MPIYNRLKNESGTALLTALFIMSLVAITTTAMIKRLNLEITRTTHYLDADRFNLAAQVAQFWSLSVLKTWEKPLPLPDEHGRIFVTPNEIKRLYPGFQVTGEIYDLQALFNLNNLTLEPMQGVFLRLVQSISPASSDAFIQSIISATLDWISPATTSQNKWSQYYASLSNPYLPAHQLMQSVFEFNRVAGINLRLFEALFPFITTLPETTKINLNTTSPLILKHLLGKPNPEFVEAVLAARSKEEGIQEEQFNDLLKKYNVDPNLVTFQSNYFLSVARAKHGRDTLVINTVIKRQVDTSQPPSARGQPEKWEVIVVKQTVS